MAKVCDLCEKGKLSGHSVSFSLKKNKRSWSPNLVKAKINVSGKMVPARICAKCLKSLNK